MKNFKKGFTLIELLVVIAIIGILSVIVLVSLSSSKTKSRIATAQSVVKSAQSGASICILEPLSISNPSAGAAICAGSSAKWSALPGGWTYGATATSDTSAGTFSFTATGDGKTITCTQAKCTTS